MSIVNVVALLGGMALFLYGITLMGDGLNKVAGNQLQVVLYRLTSNPLKGVLLGIGVTALIQSSSATSIMAIGFPRMALRPTTTACLPESGMLYALRRRIMPAGVAQP